MALTKIFTGMEKGPEAIDANFNGLSDDIKANKPSDTGWIPLVIQAGGWSGGIAVRKIGQEIRLRGELHPSGAAANNLVFTTLPAGMTTLAWVGAAAINDYGKSFAVVMQDGQKISVNNIVAGDTSTIRLNGTSFWE